MSFLAGLTTRQRQRLVRLRTAVEEGRVSDFDHVAADGAWYCPMLDRDVGPPNYGGVPRCPRKALDDMEGREVPNR